MGILLITQFLLASCNEKNDKYVAVINGEKISIGEFKVYLVEMQANFEQTGGADIWDTDFEGKTAEEVAKEGTLNSIIYIKVSAQRAREIGLKLTQEEMEQAKQKANAYINDMDKKDFERLEITDKQLIQMMEENALFNKIYLETTKGFELSEKDFEDFFELQKAEWMKQRESEEQKVTDKEIEQYKEMVREYYKTLKQSDIFDQEYEKWQSSAIIEKNESVWAEIHIER